MTKSKKQKKRNKQYPPLSKVDKILYGVPTIFFLAVYPFTFFAFDFILPEIYLRDGVIAYSPENPFPSFLLLIVTFIFFIIATDKQNKRIPIFGNSSVDYYNTINYRFVLPPFDKRYSKQNKDNKSTEKELIKISIYIFVFIFAFIIALNSFSSRYVIDDGKIYKYGLSENPIETISVEEVKEYHLKSYMSSSGRSKRSYPTISVILRTKDEKEISFDINCIKDLSSLQKIDLLFSNVEKTVDSSYLEEYIARNLTDNEAVLLRNIFENKK